MTCRSKCKASSKGRSTTWTSNVTQAHAGEWWSFDLRFIEHGSAVQAKMFLLDAEDRRVVFNGNRDDYLETPFIEHTFEHDGTYYIKPDQDRGPRGFNFGKSSVYMLRISALPTIRSVSPLGGRVGTQTRITLRGSGMDSVEQVYLTQVRAGEYARQPGIPSRVPKTGTFTCCTGSGRCRCRAGSVDRARTNSFGSKKVSQGAVSAGTPFSPLNQRL